MTSARACSPVPPRNVTVAQALESARARLRGSGSARADAELLLAHALRRERSWLIAHGDIALTPEQAECFDALIVRRATGVPVAYLLGVAWFCGRPFAVSEAVLVPRPETEHLAETAVEHLRSYAHPAVLDVGTGSGAIACTLAAELPRALVCATDRSAAALELARRNAHDLGLISCRSAGKVCHPERGAQRRVEGRRTDEGSRIHFELADLLPTGENLWFDAVVANLPYIPTANLPNAPDPVSFEPREALDGGADGLDAYRRLLHVLPGNLNKRALVLLETAPPTIGTLRELAAAAFPDAKISIGSDYAALARFIGISIGP